MFAGRYLWWVLTGLTFITVALFALESLSFTMANLFGCGSSDNTCSVLAYGINTTLKPVMAWGGFGLIAGSLAVRIAWLGFNPLWIPPVLVWSLSLGATLRSYLPLWYGYVDLKLLTGVLPPAGYGLAALALFLCLPLEDESGDKTRIEPAPIGRLAGVAAGVLTFHVVITATGLSPVLVQTFHMPAAARLVLAVQNGLAGALHLDVKDPTPGLLAALTLALALVLRVVRVNLAAPTASSKSASAS